MHERHHWWWCLEDVYTMSFVNMKIAFYIPLSPEKKNSIISNRIYSIWKSFYYNYQQKARKLFISYTEKLSFHLKHLLLVENHCFLALQSSLALSLRTIKRVKVPLYRLLHSKPLQKLQTHNQSTTTIKHQIDFYRGFSLLRLSFCW